MRPLICILLAFAVAQPLAAQKYIGTARVPAELATSEELFNGCMDTLSLAGYILTTVDVANGILSGSRTSRSFGSSKEYTFTWNVTIRPKDDGVTEVRMIRGTSGTFPPTDLDKLFPYVLGERMNLDLSKIEVTIGDETRMADEWGKKKKKKRRRRN